MPDATRNTTTTLALIIAIIEFRPCDPFIRTQQHLILTSAGTQPPYLPCHFLFTD